MDFIRVSGILKRLERLHQPGRGEKLGKEIESHLSFGGIRVIRVIRG